MMSLALINLLKRLAPYIAIALFIAGVWWHGYHTADKHRIEREAQIAAESNLLIAKSRQRNADIQAQAAESARIIGETYDTNHKTIDDLTSANRALLARLRQQPAAGCHSGGMPEVTGTASADDAPTAGVWVVFQGFVDRSAIADEVTETARACQAYVKNLQESFK